MTRGLPEYDYLFVGLFAVTDYSGWRRGRGRTDFSDLAELKNSVGYLQSYFKKQNAKIRGKINPSANDIREEVGLLKRAVDNIKRVDPSAKIGVLLYIAGHGDQEEGSRLAKFFATRTDDKIESNQLDTHAFQSTVFRTLSDAHHVLVVLDCCNAKLKSQGAPAPAKRKLLPKARSIKRRLPSIKAAYNSKARQTIYASLAEQKAFVDEKGSKLCRYLLENVNQLEVAPAASAIIRVQEQMESFANRPTCDPHEGCGGGDFLFGIKARWGSLKEKLEWDKANPKIEESPQSWKFSRRHVIVAGAAFGATGLGLYSLWPKTKVQCNSLALTALIPHFYAVKKGFYRDEGLDIVEHELTTPVQQLNALQEGKCDFLPTVSLLDVAASAVGKREPTILVLSHSHISSGKQFDHLMSLENTKLNSSSLKDCKIGIWKSNTTMPFVKWYCKEKHKIEIRDEQFVVAEKDQRDLAKMLVKGEVKFAFMYEPYITYAKSRWPGKIKEGPALFSQFHEDAPIACAGISRKLAQNSPAVAEKIERAWNRAISAIRDHDELLWIHRNLATAYFPTLSIGNLTNAANGWIAMCDSRRVNEKNSLSDCISKLQNDASALPQGKIPELSLHSFLAEQKNLRGP